jgi:hypothetical protein
MRTLLFTAFDKKYEPLANLTVELMAQYADRHGLDFVCCANPELCSPDGIYWLKFHLAPEYLQTYDRIIWLDADQMITNPVHQFLAVPPYGFHVPKDWGFDAIEPWHFSVCGFVAHQDCIPLFEEVLTMEEGARGKEFPEQTPMREVARRHMGYGDQTEAELLTSVSVGVSPIRVHRPRFLNAVPNEVCPGKVVEPWRPGDFAAHLTMRSIKERVALAHEILQRTVAHS